MRQLQSIADNMLTAGKGIVVFDSFCVLCNGAVRFLSGIDRHNRLLFTSFDSNAWKSLNISLPEKTDSVVFLYGNTCSLRSDAIVEIIRVLPYPYRLLLFIRLVPRSVREWIYKIIARNRYLIFGRNNSCRIPSDKTKGAYLF
jgi:predicted DCC family thiol-disulfide oxidoreductase YuxK